MISHLYFAGDFNNLWDNIVRTAIPNNLRSVVIQRCEKMNTWKELKCAIFPSVLVLFRIFRTENKEYKYFIQKHDSSNGNAHQSSFLFVDLIQIDTCNCRYYLWLSPTRVVNEKNSNTDFLICKEDWAACLTLTKGPYGNMRKKTAVSQMGQLRLFVQVWRTTEKVPFLIA